jgi:hypothetical protein
VLVIVFMRRDDENGIDERSHRFFVDVLAFIDTIPPGPKTNRLIEQLADAAGSIGGNRAEHSAARRARSSSGSMRSRYAAQTNQCAGCERVPRGSSVRSSSVSRCSTRAANWREYSAGSSSRQNVATESACRTTPDV